MPAESAHCARARDAAPYVLGELQGRQQESFVRHLRRCERCAEEVDLLQQAADAVPLLAARHVPPPVDEQPEPRAAALSAAAGRARPAASSAAGASMPRAGGERQPAAGRPLLRSIEGGATQRSHGSARPPGGRRVLPSSVPRPALIGFLALAVLAVATVALSGRAASVHYVRIKAGWSSGGAALKLQGNQLELLVEGMPKPKRGSGYEVWVGDRLTQQLRPTGSWLHLNRIGEAGVTVPGNYHDWYAIAVYVEPLHGQDSIRSGAVAVGDLRHQR